MNSREYQALALVFLGVSSVTTQLLTIREFLSQFHGNEITVSLSIFTWLLLTGLGSLIAKPMRRASPGLLSLLLLLAALMPLTQIASIRFLRGIAFVHGLSPGFYPVFLFIIATTAPYCLLSGFIIPLVQIVSRSTGSLLESGTVYSLDSAGDIAGGLLFSFIIVYLLTPFKAVAATSTPLIVLAVKGLTRPGRVKFLILFMIPILGFYLFSLWPKLETETLMGQYGEVLSYGESPYGRIIVTREGDQKSIWGSGVPLYSDREVVNSEEKIHYALSQLDRVESVLLVSGGLGETLEEVFKYKPASVDYVELDPFVTGLGTDHGLIRKGSSANIINTDGRRHLKETEHRYDAVIYDLPEPDSFQLNRFYTSECMALVKKSLRGKGIFAMSVDYSPNYISRLERQKLSILVSTMKTHFDNVLILPGEKAYLLARDGELHEDIPSRISIKGISSSYVSAFFYGNVTGERIQAVNQAIDSVAPINRDFSPGLMRIVFADWFARYGSSPYIFLFVVLGLVTVYLIFLRREEYLLFSTGFVIMGAEMLVVFSFQVIYGYLYVQIGAIVTAFLAGLLPGALLGKSSWGRLASHKKLFISEAILMALLVLFLVWIGVYRIDLPPAVFLAYCVVFSGVCGFQFPVVAYLIGEDKGPLAGCLAADLWGAALGTLATGTVLIPLWGMEISAIVLIALKISSIILKALK